MAIKGTISIPRTLTDERGVEYIQFEHIDLDELDAEVETKPEDKPADWATLRGVSGVSSQTKAQNQAAYVLGRIFGTEPPPAKSKK